ncbi:TIGR02117 family protein [Neolewinella lacunae]|uniref:TIGR02117 family protein n=1 Tax=Neolewinella lacunae TaxID=1517758 RepID=A0A923PQH1_9BACT|nr:TIGR02117 family protein [Neolewinella lacunae]MBC6994882.1 TIGR02117 family protein [Neolewinella lacunae]MDN3636802.1 TIGR02117 family protein [Neolewinella lacunae]
MKIVFLYLKRFALFIVAFLLLYVVFSLLLTYLPTRPQASKGEKNRVMYISSNGVHLDIILPVNALPDAFLRQLRPAASTELLAFGWGDKGFYLDTPTWAELRASVAFKAMFLPSPTAMHVTEHRAVAQGWSKVALTQVQSEVLIAYLLRSFRTTADGQITEIPDAGYTSKDRFYEAVGNYSCFKTCNTWANTAMKRIGVRTAVWTPIDRGVLRYL